MSATDSIPPVASASGKLACDPEVEAWCFEYAPTVDPWQDMAKASQPTLILRAGETRGHGSPTGQNAAEVFPNAFETVIEDSDHFIPMRRPDAVAEAMTMSAVSGMAPGGRGGPDQVCETRFGGGDWGIEPGSRSFWTGNGGGYRMSGHSKKVGATGLALAPAGHSP